MSEQTTEQLSAAEQAALDADEAIENAGGDIPAALHRAGKNAANTRWALTGKGAETNPPTADRKKALKRTLTRQERLVKELRRRRDDDLDAAEAELAE